MTAVRALIVVAVCYAIVWLLVGCGSTIRLDYTGKGGSAGIGITLPDAPERYDDTEGPNFGIGPYQSEVLRNFPNARAKKVADVYEIQLARGTIAYVTGPTETTAWRMAAKKLR